MSLEQYRDMRERAFDRYKLNAQVLKGDAINPRPNNQDSREKDALSKLPGNVKEMFPILDNYPEIDRTNRHTLASGLVHLLQQPVDETGPMADCARECTILSKAASDIPTTEDWTSLFESPGAAQWPDPFQFDPAKYGLGEVEEK